MLPSFLRISYSHPGPIGNISVIEQRITMQATSDWGSGEQISKLVWRAFGGNLQAFARDDVLVTAGQPNPVMFALCSGWVGLCRSAVDGSSTPVSVAVPGDLVGAALLAAAGADKAACLGPVIAVAAEEALLYNMAADDPCGVRWLASKLEEQRRWAKTRSADCRDGTERHRVAALLSWIRDRLESQKGELVDAFVLPLSPKEAARLVRASLPQFASALEWLVDIRILRCAYPTANGVVIGVADTQLLRMVGAAKAAPARGLA